jgi:hypothetical protein
MTIKISNAIQNSAYFHKLLFFLFCSGFGVLTFAQSLEQIKNQEIETRTKMLQISKELGVTCTACHLVEDYKNKSKKSYKVAEEHMRAVTLLKEIGFDGKKSTEANCYFCHKGQLYPQVTPPKGLNEPRPFEKTDSSKEP